MSPRLSSRKAAATRPEGPSVGAILRARRKELEWQIDDVAQWLRIRPKLLLALEDDNAAALPGTAYAIGFLRSYAEAMQLDADSLVEQYRRSARNFVSRKTELIFPQPEGERGLPIGLLIGVGLAFVVGSYVLWYHYSLHDVQAERHIPAVTELTSGAATPETTSPQVASVMPGHAPEPLPKETVLEPKPEEKNDSFESPFSASETPQSSAPITDNQLLQQSQQDAEVAEKPSVPVPPSDHKDQDDLKPAENKPDIPNNSVTVHTVSSVWIQIKDKTGHVVVSRVMGAGESWQGLEDAAPFKMSFGNAGGVVLSTNGGVSAPLGRQGEVRRNVEITADSIRSGAFGTGALPTDEHKNLPQNLLPTEDNQSTNHSSVGNGNSEDQPQTKDTPSPRPKPKPPVRKHKSSDISADDLNARQLDQATTTH
ncbi:helix-turn-helix domain-containing protein [Swingsia samuiensis]|uniref:Helix-turn-helix domain-containing protein n=1 Tax=Swingsia samuiensis TaxID=1293412 RepID=A0A4Y6UF52_9PROT|nr:helix-turn-helix domain-containing protein [Swingsia samuiensis]QDH16162.1 helix-turn-helix domain-containing protein [Swingsia samuiensis]